MTEVDDRGLALRNVQFDIDDLDGAFECLDELWLETLDPADAETYVAARDAYVSYVELDRAGVEARLAPDFTFVDHRPLSFGEIGRDGFFELFDTRRSTRGPGEARFPVVHFVSGGVLVALTEEHTQVEDGGSLASGGIFVVQVLDGRNRRCEIFADDQLNSALARANELAGLE